MCITFPEYIDGPIRQRLVEITELVRQRLPEAPHEVFVSTSSEEESLNYLGVWLFTPRLVVEIRGPLRNARIHYEIARFRDAVDWIRVNARNYEFGKCDRGSELEVEFSTQDGLTSVLSANGEGCGRLMEVYENIFLPNFIGSRNDDDRATDE